jgi:thioredoxin-related protein
MLCIARQLSAILVLLVSGLVLTAGATRADDAAGLRMLMIEQPGCAYCVAFNRDIAPIYERSPEGAAAPLVHVDLRADMPEDVTLAYPPSTTPTFILVGPDGNELSRLIGFPGEDFFWAYVGDMIRQAQNDLDLSPVN